MATDPSPLEFVDYRAYLNAWFEHRKFRPSMARFARDVKCSRQLVSSICAGHRNLGEVRAPAWADRLGLTDQGKTYFLALVRSEEGATPAACKEAFGSVQAMRAHQQSQSDELITGLAAHWLRSVIHEMGRWPGFEPNVDWVAVRLGPGATAQEIEEALGWLSKKGLLGEDGQQAIHAALASEVESSKGAMTQALAQHHFDLLNIARLQLPTVPPQQRTYLSITAAITADQLSRLQEAIKDFQQRMYAIASEVPTDPLDRVYSLAIQLFPLAQEPSED